MKSYYQWHRRTLLGRSCVWVMASMVMALQCLPGYFALTYADVPPGEEEDAVQVAQANTTDSTTDSTTASTSSAEDGDVEGDVEEGGGSQPLPPALLTLGVRAGEEGLFEGVADILLPIWFTGENGLLFVSPRASFTDNDEQEYNVGLGFRQYIECDEGEGAILGANVFYDSRYSANDNQFDQVGFGAELLTKKVDARFNYYLPDDKEEVIDEFTRETTTSSTSSSSSSSIDYGAIAPEGNDFVQEARVKTTTRTTTTRTTTRFHFKRFEAALEGWDAEIGVIIPGTENIAETRVFIGYQSFENPFSGDDLEGLKGRIEIRALPGVFLDGEWFEADELNGTDFFVGARVQVPIDLVNLVNGKNPFEGAGDNFKKSKESTVLDRIAREQVIRDPRIQTVESGAIEQEEMRETIVSKSTKTKTSEEDTEITILNDIEFVDSDNVGPEDGTFENPWNSFDEAIAAAESEGTSIYVFDKGITYTGSSTLDMADGTVFLGSGKAVYGLGGVKYTAPSATHPTIDGPGTGPIVRMGEDTTVGGLRLINPGAASGLVVITGSASGTPYDVTRAAIIAEDKSGLTIMDNLFDDVTYAAVLVDTLSGSSDAFEATVMGNEIQSLGAVSGGVVIDTKGASGTFDVSIVNNDFSGTGGDGLFVDALVYDDSTLYIENLTASSNADDGADITLDDNAQTVSLSILTGAFALNGDVGIQIRDLYAGYMASATFSNISASHNVYHGIHFMGGGPATDTGAASMVFHNISASRNGWIFGNGSGIYIDGDGAYSDSGSASVAFSALSLGNNADHGLYIDGDGAESGAGDSSFSLTDSEIAANGWFFADGHGVYINGDAADSSGTGDATVTFSSLTLRGNTVHGLYVNGHGADANGTGDASLTMSQLSVISNGWGTADGIGIFVNGHGATADGGSATTRLTAITVTGNAHHGLFINGHGAEGDGAGATALLVMDSISASPNGWGTADGIGLYVNGHGATADSGSATTRLSNIEINGNPHHGLYINGAGATASGDAWFSMADSSIIGSGFGTGDGLGVYIAGQAASSTSGGDATAVFDTLTITGNADDGLFVDGTGARAVGGGDASLTMNELTVITNGWGFNADGMGIYFNGGSAYASDGSARAVFTNITVTRNADHGLFVSGEGAEAGGAGSTATLIMDGISASPNGWGTGDGIGVYVEGHGAWASSASGSATTRISNVHINGNPHHGLYIDGDGALAGGDTWFSLTDSSFEGNGFGTGDGIGVYISGNAAYSFMGGNATALFDPLTISGNAGHGLYIDGNGARAMGGGDASLIMDKITTYNNGWGFNADGVGIHISSDGAYAGGGSASASFTYITTTANASHGLYINGDGADAGGAGASALLVMNHISASPNGWGTGSGHAIYISGSGALDAGGSGSATTRISNVAADGIAGYGLLIVGDGAIAGGDAYFSLTDADFDGNGWGTGDGGSVFIDGRAAASSSGGDATAVFDGVTTTGDADTGIVILGDGAQAFGGGDASFTMNDVSGINNGWGPGIAPGILISGDAAYSAAGSASAVFTSITVTSNAGHGLQIAGDGAEGGTSALFVMDGVSAGNNGFGPAFADGVFIDGNGASSFAGSATARVSNVEASGNSDHGFFIDGFGAVAGGDAYFSLIDSEFVGNGFNAGSGNGFYIDGSAAYSFAFGDATAYFDPITATGNAGHGIFIQSYGAIASGVGADASFYLDGLTASHNGGYGLYFGESIAFAGSSGDAYAYLTNISAAGNGEYGFFTTQYGAYSEGGDASFALENTAVYMNGSSDGIYFNNTVAFSDGGSASAAFRGISATDHSGSGISLSAHGAAAYGVGGNASFYLTDSTLTGNGASGFGVISHAAYAANGGNAYVFVDPISASYNGDYGLYFGDDAAYAFGGGDATFYMDGVTASYNGNSGVYFGGSVAKASTGSAYATLNNLTVISNSRYGLYINDEAAYGYGMFSGFTMSDVYAYDNGADGLYFGSQVAYLQDGLTEGVASAYFSMVSSSYNGDYGLFIDREGAFADDNGHASFTIDGAVFYANDDDGFHVAGYAAYAEKGNTTVHLEDIYAAYNSGNGLYFEETVAYSPISPTFRAVTASVTMRNITASYNTLSGISISGHGAYVGYVGNSLTASYAGAAIFNASYLNLHGNLSSGFLVVSSLATGRYGNDALVRLNYISAAYNGQYGFYANYGAYSESGAYAFFGLSNSSFYANGQNPGDYSGFYIDESLAFADDGLGYMTTTAKTVIYNVEANYNAGYGFFFGGDYAAYAEEGNAYVYMNHVTASYNGDYGIYFDEGAYAEEGSAYFSLDGGEASFNNQGGLFFGDKIAESDDGGAITGTATASIRNFNALSNGYFGINADYGAYAEYGSSSLTLYNISASYNGYGGIQFDDSLAFTGQTTSYGGMLYSRATLGHITASYNMHSGISIGGYGSYLYGYGDSTFRASYLSLHGNSSSGFFAISGLAAGRYSGNGSVYMNNISASNNADYGFYANYGAYAEDGAAYFLLRDGVFYGNGYAGFYIDESVAFADDGTGYSDTDAAAYFDNVEASYNSTYGFFLGGDYGAYAEYGNASLILNNVTASENGEEGIYMDHGAYADGAGHQGSLRLTDVTLYSNGDYGLYVGSYGGFGEEGAGYVRFFGVSASFNGDDGIFFTEYAAYSAGPGKADFHFLDSESSYNSGYGVYVGSRYAAYASGGTAQALWRNSVISGNTSGGVWNGGAFSEGGAFASTDIVNTDFIGNGGDGINTTTYADDGTANVTALNSVFANNTGDGIEALVETGTGSINLNLGRSTGGGGFNKGSNSIFGNGGFGANNTGVELGTIENNFWGGGAPAAGTDYDAGGWTAPSTFKGSDPND